MEQTRQTLEAQVLERAAKDPQFREQLKHDPRQPVSREEWLAKWSELSQRDAPR